VGKMAGPGVGRTRDISDSREARRRTVVVLAGTVAKTLRLQSKILNGVVTGIRCSDKV